MKSLVEDEWPCEDVIVEACKNCNEKACCEKYFVPLTPPERLRLKTYDKFLPGGGPEITAFFLAKKENNECYYLTPQGCSIWSSRPNACREYSCMEEEFLQISFKL